MNDENYFGNENQCESDELEHYGTPRHSGRYPWGSGDNPYQRDAGFLSRVHTMREQGLTDTDIYKSMGMNSSQFRKALSLAKTQQRAADAAEAWRLHEKGYSTMAIGRRMGKNESTIRLYLDERLKERANKTRINADILKEFVSTSIKFIVEPIQQHELLFVVDKALDAISVEPSSLTARTVGGTHINLWLVAVRVHQRQ